MKKKLIIRSLILIMLVGVIYEISTIVISFNENNTILEDIEITNKFNNKKQMISIKVENDDDYEYHDYEDKTKWPDPNIYTYAGSLCTDWGGNTIADNIIKFDEVNYKATITTKKTAYCTLYFTKGKKAMDHLKVKGGSSFNSTNAVFGLYRFKGTNSQVLNNYICFGTTDIATCLGDKQTYMYRIIGITDGTETNTILGLEANQLKIIKSYPSSQSQIWHYIGEDAKWDGTDPVADIQVYLNDTFLTKEKAKWKNTYWEGIIDEPYWYIGDNTNSNATTESGKSTAIHKVGLMYKSDYVNACQNNSTDNWLFISNGLSGNPIKKEWTMTRYGYSAAMGYHAWYVDIGGWLTDNFYDDTKYAVRPVYYLLSNASLIGEGTETSPFIITSKN